MAETVSESVPGDDNDDNWLYGDSNPELNKNGEKDQGKDGTDPTADGDEKDENENGNDDQFNDEHFAEVAKDNEAENGDAESQDNGDSDSDDSDDVKVTIGEIKSGPQAYPSLNIKRGGLVATAASGGEKARTGAAPSNKVTLDDLEGPGSINGVPALEFNIDTIEDKPWNKPGADISDYFNYGFNEVTWSAYCDRQRRLRVSEAGVSMHSVPPPRAPPPDRSRQNAMMRNEDNMPPPMANQYIARENTIQVMTADRREYGRRDPPAPEYFPPAPQHAPEMYYPPIVHQPHPHPQHPHPHQHQPYEEAWGQPGPGWVPNEIKELTPGPMGPPQLGPPMGMGAPMPGVQHQSPFPPPYRAHPHLPPHGLDRDRERDRERDRDRERSRDRMRERDERERRDRDRDRRDEEDRDRERERSRSIKPDRIREKSYRRDRSRSRSRRHKSRSRSPRPRERERSPRERERERSVKPKHKESQKEKEEEK